MDQSLLAALELANALAPSATNIAKVADTVGDVAARWAFTQWELRARGAAKFDRADEMLFERDGLEMATSLPLARYHASCFPVGLAVADMTCGIGSDTIALAERGPVVAFDLDSERLELARWNVGVYQQTAELRQQDSLDAVVEFSYAFCDPARRSGGRRTLDLSQFSPNPVLVAQRMRDIQVGGIKLSPMLDDVDLESLGDRLEFVSFGGECREALVWFGREHGRFAVHVETGDTLESGKEADSSGPRQYLYEADPAAIRAHCLGKLCENLGLSILADSNGYLTSDTIVHSPWLTPYEILAALKGDLKETKAKLRELGGGTPIVKSRAGVDVDTLRRQLRGEGEELIVAAYPEGRSIRHLILRRLAS